MYRFRLLALGLGVALSLQAWSQSYTLTILHQNDTHARLESTSIQGKKYGGFSRVATLIQQERAKAVNPILLHGGDAFQGTLFFNVYEGLADLACFNHMGYTAMAVGNHEFDRGPGPLGTFARNAKFPVLAANIDVSAEPALVDIIKPSAIVVVGGQRIGIVGAVTEDLPFISSPGDNVKMKPWIQSVQAEIDRLTQLGINKIIVVSHSGYDFESDAATKLKRIDVLVGGHSHSLLGQLQVPGFPGGRGAYPTLVKNADGDQALVVQAWEWGKVLGRLKVEFDEAGRVKSWDGAVIPVDESIPEDPFIKGLIAAFRKPIDQLAKTVVAKAEAAIPRSGQVMGELIADAQLEATKKNETVLALMNPGGIRADLDAGDVTYEEAIAVQPFSNTLVVLELTGAEIKTALEQMASRPEGRPYFRISKGSSYEVDFNQPEGSRVSQVMVAGAPLDPAKTYRVVVNSFLAGGGDAITVLKEAKGYRYDTGMMDVDAFIDYLKARTPVVATAENRVSIKNP